MIRLLTPLVTSKDAMPQFEDYVIVAVIPAYNEGRHIQQVLRNLPGWLRHIVVVDDASRDDTAAQIEELAAFDPRIQLIRHERNAGVGGAMISGLRRARDLGAQVVVKLDGDGQMPVDRLADLLAPLVRGEADFAKGNRFHDFSTLARMPLLRRAGNMGLSFLTKAAVGYWRCFDPCNGYVALRGEVLDALRLESLHRTYFFETSLLAEVYLLGAYVQDVPMHAVYGNEVSHLSITRVLLEFPPKLAYCFFRRLALKNFVYDFSMESLYLLSGLPLLLAGILYGGWNWYGYSSAGLPAPTGTVVIPAMLIILGFQLLLSAVSEDLRSAPEEPVCRRPLPPKE